MPRRSLAAYQWQRVAAMVDHEFADESLPRAVAAGGGRDFQRLEFLGDRVLELSVATGLAHAAGSGNEMAGSRLDRLVAKATDARSLHGASLRTQLASLVGVRAGRRRQGDVVEAAAGALFLDGGWAPLDAFAVRAGLLPQAPTVRAAPSSRSASVDLGDDRGEELATLGADPVALGRARVVGGHAIEATFAWWAVRTMPGRDEGVLHEMTSRRTSGAALAALANRFPVAAPFGRPENRLRAWVGAVAQAHGRSVAVDLVSRLADLGLPPVPPFPPGSR